MRPTVNGVNPFSTATRHLAFCDHAGRFLGHAQIRLSGATSRSTNGSGHRATPFSTKAARNSRTGTSPVRHFRPVWMTIANVNATAAAEAP